MLITEKGCLLTVEEDKPPAYFSVQGGASPFPALGIVSYYPTAALVPTQTSSDTLLFRETFRCPRDSPLYMSYREQCTVTNLSVYSFSAFFAIP
jgi:hypothetical protein